MFGQENGRTLECVLVDLNTQRDFLEQGGACLVQNSATLVGNVRRVIAWAKWNHAPVVSGIDAHRSTEPHHDGFPGHCLDGTPGQRKLPFTLFGSRIRIEGDNMISVPLDLFREHQQVIFLKRTHDLLGNPKADRFFTQTQAGQFVLFGVGLEYSIKSLALGLMSRGKSVAVVGDCCGYWNRSEAVLTLRLLAARGAQILTADELLSRRLRRYHRYPLHSPSHNGNGRANGNGHNGLHNGLASQARRNGRKSEGGSSTQPLPH